MKIPAGMAPQGHAIDLVKTHAAHQGPKAGLAEGAEPSKAFSEVLSDTLTKVSDLDQTSSELATQFITDPESVNAHDVTIAMSKANMAVSLTKSVVDGAVKAYKEIISLR